ncbi:MAG: PHP domain-containing protein [Acidobacteriota bacterium]|nr:PHP domain-containing protein [Blastocatellia bacterium]MDW8412294.1 PHP domain-containing protein [Acidobacteriota bacterium]
MIDLHLHTTASDGSLTPRELVARAARIGVTAIAITDHDTTEGLQEARQYAAYFNLEVVAGVEISAEYEGTMHILGYFIDPKCETLQNRLEQMRAARKVRNPQIVEKLRSLGLKISLDEVIAVSGNKQVVGRPHFARVMLEKGYVKSIEEAFEKYLKKGAPAYVPKERLCPKAAIETIHAAGGVAVLAHPYQLKLPAHTLQTVVAELVTFGLDGIEAIYSRHSQQQTEFYTELAKRYDLLITGGSDFHGAVKPDIEIGLGLGNLCVPEKILDTLRTRSGKCKCTSMRECLN